MLENPIVQPQSEKVESEYQSNTFLPKKLPNDQKLPLPKGPPRMKIKNSKKQGITEINDIENEHWQLKELNKIVSEESDDESSNKTEKIAEIIHLQKGIAFMQEQHRSILGSLQKEIDKLKNENKGMVSSISIFI